MGFIAEGYCFAYGLLAELKPFFCVNRHDNRNVSIIHSCLASSDKAYKGTRLVDIVVSS
jgi:hypothetical protein